MVTITHSTFAGILVLDIASDRTREHDHYSNFADQVFEFISESPCEQILLDLQGFSFITSEVIGQLIMLNKKCHANDYQLKLCGVSEENKTALKIVRFDTLVDIYDRKAQAIAAFKIEAQKPVEPSPAFDRTADEYLVRADHGDLDAQFRYGKCLESGIGVQQDFEAALKWYEKAATQGHIESQHALGVAFAYGIGVPQDFDLAFYWFKRAADHGHAEAQHMIGMSLQYGLVDEVDIHRAIKWYKEAAEQGYQPSQEAIDELNRDGPPE